MKSRSSAVLLVLAIVALASSFGVAQYTPKWHVGDWWVVKTWQRDGLRTKWAFYTWRYDVVGMERVNDRDCYVLQMRPRDSRPEHAGIRDLYYVRADSGIVVRQVSYWLAQGQIRGPGVFDFPYGLHGPFLTQPRLPAFPVDTGGTRDTMFRLQRTKYRSQYVGSAYLREIAGIAHSALVNRWLNVGDTLGERVLRPSGGTVYSVQLDMGKHGLTPGPHPGDSIRLTATRSLQFWCEDYPWRLYEELHGCGPDGRSGKVLQQSWLIASGRSGR